MQFRTQVPIPTFDHPIDYSSRIVSLGSCFADNIAEKFDYFQFLNTVNPFGILFHPMAVERFLGFAAAQKIFSSEDVFYHNERWHSFDAHSELSDPDKNVVLEKLNRAISDSHDKLLRATHLIITLGTAWSYRSLKTRQTVANCHKVPQNHFIKELQPVADITASLRNTIQSLRNVNSNLKLIFTVSPVRHIKDGFVANQRSKAHLLTALHEIRDTNPDVNYFPSYEIMMDELRDYRFYGSDMLHPNQTAVDYIWERFATHYISSDASATMDKVHRIRSGLAHRSFNPASEQHTKFLTNLSDKIFAVQQQHPHIKFK